MPFLEDQSKNHLPKLDTPQLARGDDAIPWMRNTYTPTPSYEGAARGLPPLDKGRLTCANSECTSIWTVPWKNRRRPIFEGHWGCGTRCLNAIIRRALRRERGDLQSPLAAEMLHRHRVPLGLVMLAQNWITPLQLRQALEAQRSAGEGRIGDWLVQACDVSPVLVTRGLALQWSCPVLPMDGFAPATMALTIPRILIEELSLLPLRIAGSRILYIAFNDRLDASAVFAVGQMSGLRVESGLLDDTQFRTSRDRLLESTFVPATQEYFLDIDKLSARIAAVLERTQPVGSRLIRVHQHYWLRTWLEAGAYSGVGTLPSTGEDVADTIFTLGSQA
jgi:hypothetical protein